MATINLPDALLLDLDDTILDITSSADACWRTLAAKSAPNLGVDVGRLVIEVIEARNAFWRDQARLDKWRTDVHGATRLILTDCFAAMGIGSPDIACEIAELFRLQRNDFLTPFPGAIEALGQLRSQVGRLGLITNGAADWQRQKIEKFELAPFFDCILIEGECGYGKPDERIYRQALDALDVAPSHAWMVGDNLEWDVAAAQRVGLTGIWMDWGRKGLPHTSPVRPDRIIAHLSDLL